MNTYHLPSLYPTASNAPTTETEKIYADCSEDGSLGVTDENSWSEVSFIYSIRSLRGNMTEEITSGFEKELNMRLACINDLFDPCLNCSNINDGLIDVRQRVEHLTGITPFPNDIPALLRCSDAKVDCWVMNGMFNVYFDESSTQEIMEKEVALIKLQVDKELSKDNWNGLQIDHNNTSFIETEAGGFFDQMSKVAVVGISVGVVVLVSGALYAEYGRG